LFAGFADADAASDVGPFSPAQPMMPITSNRKSEKPLDISSALQAGGAPALQNSAGVILVVIAAWSAASSDK
jgi:hypothetical protein